MKEVLGQALAWQRSGKRFALATVVAVEGSGPRETGAMMAVSEDGQVVGSVSGGCVESAVVADALERMGAPGPVLERFGLPGGNPADATTVAFGFSDDEAVAVGLTCGGTFHILIEPDPPAFIGDLVAALDGGRSFALALVYACNEETGSYFAEENAATEVPAIGSAMAVFDDGSTLGSLGNADLDRVVARDALGAISQAKGTRRFYGRRGQTRSREVAVVTSVAGKPPRMVIFGAVDFTGSLSEVARFLGYQVIVADARPVFATRERFPAASEVVVAWPDSYLKEHGGELDARDAICVLTHDPKFDVPAVIAALGTRAGYIGIMGSRRTQADRRERLGEAGADLAEFDRRVCGPIGLDLGSRTPEETAISIVAEIISRREGRSAVSLSVTGGSIHTEGAMTW